MGKGPLDGIRVLDFTVYQNGPSATQQLADQGADVVKVEPLDGEPLRHMGAPRGVPNVGFEQFNRGKRAVALDLKHPDTAPVIRRLVEWADVLVENFRVGVLDKLGLGYDVVRQWNPRLLYCSNNGLGSVGAWATRPSYDVVAQAYTGVMHAAGGGPSHPPVPVEWAFSDEVGAMNFYSAVLAALVARGRTGEGQHIVTSQAAATLHFQRAAIASAAMVGAQRDDGKRPGWGMAQANQVLRAADGKYFIVALGTNVQWKRYASRVLRRDDLVTDPRSSTGMGRMRNKVWLLDEMARIAATRPRDEWVRACVEADVPCSPVHSYTEVAADAFLRENGYIADVKHRDHGQLTVVAPPVSYSATPLAGAPAPHAPRVGEHTEEVLRGVGFTEGDVSRLLAAGAAATRAPPRAPPRKKARL